MLLLATAVSQTSSPRQLESAEGQQLHPYEDIIEPAPRSNNKFQVAGIPQETAPDATEEESGKKQGFKVAMLPPENPEEDGGNTQAKIPHYTEVVKTKKSEQNALKDYNKLQHVPEPTLLVPPPPTSMPAAFRDTYSALDNKGAPQYELCRGESSSPPPPLIPPYDPELGTDNKIYYNETAVKRAAKMT